MENTSLANCSIIEKQYSQYWYFQLSFIAIVYTCICIINGLAILVSIRLMFIRRATETWILISCYISAFTGTISAGSNEFYQSYYGVIDYKCVTFWDRRILSTAGAQVGMYCLLALSLLRFHAVRSKTPVKGTVSRKMLSFITIVIWSAAFTTSSIGKSITGVASHLFTHILPMAIPLVTSIILHCIMVKKLRQNSVRAMHENVRRTTERAGRLISTLVVAYTFALMFAAISGSLSKLDLPRLSVWLARVMHVFCYSTEAVVFFWRTPEARQYILHSFKCSRARQVDDINEVEPAVIHRIPIIVVQSPSQV